MKKTYFLIVMVGLTIFSSIIVSAQNWVVNQVIVGSGGVFGDTTNHITLASFNPDNEATTTFGNIYTQSIQDIVIRDKYAFVAAQDSIIKFNIDTYEKIASVEAIGVNRLLINENILMASFQYPVTENFVKIFSSEDLTLITNIAEVSDESAGMLAVNQLAYVAVPGGWDSSIGKIAIIDLSNYSLLDEINFNELGIGVYDLFYYDEKIMSVNKTPWGGSFGYLLSLNSTGSHTETYLINETLGKMIGVKDGILYTIMDDGIGSIDLSDFSVIDKNIVAASQLTIADAELDTVNEMFYVTSTDYYSTGLGTIYNLVGEETGNFDAGISADAIAIDYRFNTGVTDLYSEAEIKIYPNPSSDVITVETSDGALIENFKIVDISGRIIMNSNESLNRRTLNIVINEMESGFYFLLLSDGNKQITSSFIKK